MIPLAALVPTALGFAKSNWRAIAGAVVGAALALPVGQCQGRHQERDRQAAAEAEASLVQAEKNRAAAEAATFERATDSARVITDERKRNEAIDSAPGGRAAPSSLGLGCERLRQQGVKGSALPANCRPPAAP